MRVIFNSKFPPKVHACASFFWTTSWKIPVLRFYEILQKISTSILAHARSFTLKMNGKFRACVKLTSDGWRFFFARFHKTSVYISKISINMISYWARYARQLTIIYKSWTRSALLKGTIVREFYQIFGKSGNKFPIKKFLHQYV